MSAAAAFGLFIAATTDADRLALGLDVLRAAHIYAHAINNQGWAEAIYEYVHALESGKGLNRPL